MAKVLVACEESQTVCKAFRMFGIEAYSCDLKPPSGGHPEWHIHGDADKVLDGDITFMVMTGDAYYVKQWDLIIAHPPCTYLSNAGACRLYPKKGVMDRERYEKGMVGKAFFMRCLNANCKRIAVENPVPSRVFELPEKTQSIQPYEFGHPYTKKTYLWLKGLPVLVPTNIVEPLGPYVCGNSEMWKRMAHNGVVYGKEKAPGA